MSVHPTNQVPGFGSPDIDWTKKWNDEYLPIFKSWTPQTMLGGKEGVSGMLDLINSLSRIYKQSPCGQMLKNFSRFFTSANFPKEVGGQYSPIASGVLEAFVRMIPQMCPDASHFDPPQVNVTAAILNTFNSPSMQILRQEYYSGSINSITLIENLSMMQNGGGIDTCSVGIPAILVDEALSQLKTPTSPMSISSLASGMQLSNFYAVFDSIVNWTEAQSNPIPVSSFPTNVSDFFQNFISTTINPFEPYPHTAMGYLLSKGLMPLSGVDPLPSMSLAMQTLQVLSASGGLSHLTSAQWNAFKALATSMQTLQEPPYAQNFGYFLTSLANNHATIAPVTMQWFTKAFADGFKYLTASGQLPTPGGGDFYDWISNHLAGATPSPQDFFHGQMPPFTGMSEFEVLIFNMMCCYPLQWDPPNTSKGNIFEQLQTALGVSSGNLPSPYTSSAPSQEYIDSLLSNDSNFINLLIYLAGAGNG